MIRYDEMQPVILEKPGESKVLGSNDGHEVWHRSERPCPRCRYKLGVNTRGQYHCNRCGFEDAQDLSRYAHLKGQWYHRRRFDGHHDYSLDQ